MRCLFPRGGRSGEFHCQGWISKWNTVHTICSQRRKVVSFLKMLIKIPSILENSDERLSHSYSILMNKYGGCISSPQSCILISLRGSV